MNNINGNILNSVKDLLEVKDRDKKFYKIVREVLKKLYKISKENNISDIFIELDDIGYLLENENEIDENICIQKLVRVKEILEKNNVLIFSDGNNALNELIDKLKDRNLEVTKVDVVQAILSYNCSLIIIQNNTAKDAIRILKKIREEKIVEHIPIIVFSNKDYNAKLECLKLGAIDYFDYDFDLEEVYLKILNYINMSSTGFHSKQNKSSQIEDKAWKGIRNLVDKSRLKNLLFVDDDKIIISILKSRYSNKDYNVFTASDGTEALDIIENNNIDLVVTDFYMKLMNGDELIRKIKEKHKDISIIILSSQKNEDYIKRTLDLGADDYIIKPFSPVELDSRIKKLLE